MTAPSLVLSALPRVSGPALPTPAPGFTARTLVAGAPAPSPLALWRFLRFAGTGRIAGTVKVLSAIAPGRTVRLYDKASGLLARETVSDAAGAYAFAQLDAARTYYVTAFDTATGYNATIEDRVVPG